MYFPKIGIEIHVELNTKSKMFCSCRNNPNAGTPNSEICPICMGHPGTLPVMNKEAIKKVVKTGLALNCEIAEKPWFDRKNYFYPDLPKGFQISQHFAPFCKSGHLDIIRANSQSDSQKFARIKIREIHLEEDTCKLFHSENGDFSLVDCNRAGVPLMELVTEPELNSGKEVKEFAQELQLILRYLDVSNADMEKGQMRIEANVSVSKEKGKLGTRTELKNINSFRAVEKAIDFEIKRQKKVLGSGKEIIQQTRGWNDESQETVLQREKETTYDYRYFPEPDLPAIRLEPELLEKIKAEIPELPQNKRERFKNEYFLSEKEIEVLVQNKDLGEYFEKAVSELPPNLKHDDLLKLIKLSANYLLTDLTALLKDASVESKDFLITPENFAELMGLISEGKVSSKAAKDILKVMFVTGADPSHIMTEKGLGQISDEAEIETIIQKVISENQKAISDFKSGKENALQFLVGQVMAQSRGKVKPEIAREILKKLLS